MKAIPLPILPLVDEPRRYTFVVHRRAVALFLEVDENGFLWRRTFRSKRQ